MRNLLFGLATAALLSAPVSAKMVDKRVAYEHDGQKFEGVLVYDDQVKGRRPALLMGPDWMGVSENAVAQAKVVAGKRFVVFVADMYGVEATPKNQQQAGPAARRVRDDIALTRARAAKALDVFLAEAGKANLIDAKKVAAVGFCFGGGNMLELARSGRDINAVAVFHSELTTSTVEGPGRIKARILVLHGADDSQVPKAARDKFEEEMKAAKADYQVVAFGNTVHSFTDPTANFPPNYVYNEKSAKLAYAMMRDFLAQSFLE
jgi:dienelactone hydrolase